MSKAILYTFRRCPYAIRARLALHVAGIACEQREVDLKNKPIHMLELSPKGTVPVLLLDDGTVLEESLDIMYWALGKNDPEHWLLNDIELQVKTKAIIARNDTQFKPALDRYKYPERYPDPDWQQALQQALVILQDIDSELSKTAFICGDKVSLADMAILSFIRQFAHADMDAWQGYPLPKLQVWLTHLLDSKLFQAVMQKL